MNPGLSSSRPSVLHCYDFDISMKCMELGMVVYAFNPTLRRPRLGGFCELEASLIYTVSSRTARAT